MEPQDTADDPPRYSFIDSRSSSPSDREAKRLSKDIVKPPGYPPDLSPPRTEASRKQAQAGYTYASASSDMTRLHIYKSTILSRYYKIFEDENQTRLLYIAKKTGSFWNPAMDIFYTDDKTHRRVGHITPSPDPAQSRAVNIHLGDTLRLLSTETPSDYCNHSFSSVPEERSLTWQNKDPNANDTGAVHGEHDIVLVDDTGLQIAVFRPSTRFFGRHTGSLLFSPNLSKHTRDEIVISLLA
ncbi:MAG: hypothetical protein L6R42_000331, partial [Xanthoria sp. 1 TBL-2021]